MVKERNRLEAAEDYLRWAEHHWDRVYQNYQESKDPKGLGEAMDLLDKAQQKYLDEWHREIAREIARIFPGLPTQQNQDPNAPLL